VDLMEKVTECDHKRYCCAQTVMSIGLEVLDLENDLMIKAMKGLCRGIKIQEVCGALSAGACLLALSSEEKADDMILELIKQFKDNYNVVRCIDFIGTEGSNPDLCKEIKVKTLAICLDLLDENDLI